MKILLVAVAVMVASLIAVEAERGSGRPRGPPRTGTSPPTGGPPPTGETPPARGPGVPPNGRAGKSRGPPRGNGPDRETAPDFNQTEGAINETRRHPGRSQGDPRKGGPGGHRSPRPEGDRSTWNRTLASGDIVEESALVPVNSSTVVVRSQDRELRSNNITGATSTYDFNNDTSILLIAPARPGTPCFLVYTTLTFSSVVDQLASRNGSNAPAATKVVLNGTGSPLTPAEVQSLKESNPSARRACKDRDIVRAVPLAENNQPSSNTTEIVVITLDSEVTIIALARAPRQRPTRPEGGSSRGRKGGRDGPRRN